MPYKIVKSGSGYKVAKKHGNKTFSKKPLSKKKAIAQMRAIELNTHNESGVNLCSIIESVLDEANPPGMFNAITQQDDFVVQGDEKSSDEAERDAKVKT